MTIQILKADITKLEVDVIVNAANKSLAGGGGVDGAIHAVAGPELAAEASKFAPLATSRAVITQGYKLPSKYVIHTVGPIWKGGESGEIVALAECYRSCLALAAKAGARGIAFPAISTGVYGFPAYEAAIIVIVTCHRESEKYPDLKINLVCFDDEMLETYKAAVSALSKDQSADSSNGN